MCKAQHTKFYETVTSSFCQRIPVFWSLHRFADMQPTDSISSIIEDFAFLHTMEEQRIQTQAAQCKSGLEQLVSTGKKHRLPYAITHQDRAVSGCCCSGLNQRSLTGHSCLVDTEPSEQYSNWIAAMGVKRLRVDIATNKDGVINTTTESLYEAVLYTMTKANHPIHVHCNQGKHRTGCVMACVRKVQGTMTIEEIIEEYMVYAGKKARTGDVDLIHAFDIKGFSDFASACNHVIEPYSGFYIRRRVDSATFIHELEDLADSDTDVEKLLVTTTRVTEVEDDDFLVQKSSKKLNACPPAISQEVVDRVRMIMGVDPTP
nr:tyrosine-protein phosphatase siw14 [Quercus suber]